LPQATRLHPVNLLIYCQYVAHLFSIHSPINADKAVSSPQQIAPSNRWDPPTNGLLNALTVFLPFCTTAVNYNCRQIFVFYLLYCTDSKKFPGNFSANAGIILHNLLPLSDATAAHSLSVGRDKANPLIGWPSMPQPTNAVIICLADKQRVRIMVILAASPALGAVWNWYRYEYRSMPLVGSLVRAQGVSSLWRKLRAFGACFGTPADQSPSWLCAWCWRPRRSASPPICSRP